MSKILIKISLLLLTSTSIETENPESMNRDIKLATILHTKIFGEITTSNKSLDDLKKELKNELTK